MLIVQYKPKRYRSHGQVAYFRRPEHNFDILLRAADSGVHVKGKGKGKILPRTGHEGP
jgi:hypothetical protein